VRRKSSRSGTPEAPAEEIEVAPGLGFKAFLIDDGRLQVSQDGDNVVLSRTEFKVLTAQFAPWRDAPTS
jgi:DNA-binding response OmpR family regulator